MTIAVRRAVRVAALMLAVLAAVAPTCAKADKSVFPSVAVAPNGDIWYTTFSSGNRLNDLLPNGCRKSYALGNRASQYGNVAANGAGEIAVVDGLGFRGYVVKGGVVGTVDFERITDTFFLDVVGTDGAAFWLVGSRGPMFEFSARGILQTKQLPDSIARSVAKRVAHPGFASVGKRGLSLFDDRGSFGRKPFSHGAKTISLALTADGGAWGIQERQTAPFYALRYVARGSESHLLPLPKGASYPVVTSLPNGNAVVAGDGWIRAYSPRGTVWRAVVPKRGVVTSLAYDPQMRAVLYITAEDRIGAVDESGRFTALPSGGTGTCPP